MLVPDIIKKCFSLKFGTIASSNLYLQQVFFEKLP